MGSYDPIAYTYEADVHCVDCAIDRFGRDEHGEVTGVDSEGNEVNIISPSDEWYANEIFQGEDRATLTCGTCGEVIEEIDLT